MTDKHDDRELLHRRLYGLIILTPLLLTVYSSATNAEVYTHHQLSKVAADEHSRHATSYSTGKHVNDRYSRHSGSSVRWGVGYNNYWGPSVGIGWSSGWNNRWHNRWGYNGWRSPYRYDYYDRYYRDRYMNNRPRSNYVQKATQIEAPKRTTTSIEYAKGLTQLPENARVIQRDGQTFYQWDGKEYYFDWSTERYLAVSQ